MAKESESMLEIREIRERNSARHIGMTADEISAEYREVTRRFLEEMGIDIEVVALDSEKTGLQV